jgi:putative ABC transport system permease protein
MVRNFLKVAFRNMLKQKSYSFLNIAGLATGMAACILILLWVTDEFSFNRFHENLDRIFLVAQTQHYGAKGDFTVSPTPAPLAPALEEEFPEIELATRYSPYLGDSLIQYGDKQYKERLDAADQQFLDIFTLNFLYGDPSTALNEPYDLILSEKTASKFFGDRNPLGESMTVDKKFSFKVTGVFEDLPSNSNISISMLTNYISLKDIGFNLENWGSNQLFTYVLLNKHAFPAEVSKKIEGRLQQEIDSATAGDLFLFPFEDYHLYSLSGKGGRIESVIIFAIIAGFILLIACVNFMNLATARSAKRSMEVGIKKVVGATRSDVGRQFLGEAFIFTFWALILALIIVNFTLPYFNGISGKELSLSKLTASVIWFFAGITVLTAVISGLYPAVYLSSIKPVSVLKGSRPGGRGNTALRKVLVVFQFAITISLIIATTIVYFQLEHMRSKDIGLRKDNIVYFELDNETRSQAETLKNELASTSDIKSVTLLSHVPISVYSNGGGFEWRGKDPETDELVTFLRTDYDFAETFGVKLVSGRYFSREHPSDEENSIVINETFANLTGLDPVVGEIISRGNSSFTVIGVVKDFNFTSVRGEIGPLAINLTRYLQYVFMNVESSHLERTISDIEDVYRRFNKSTALEYNFLDETFEATFKSERRQEKIFNSFAVLAIMISCFGLLGLISFVAEQKRKEIGIRKVLGAKVSSIVFHLIKEFLAWVLLANLIAWPVAFYFMKNWLSGYAYRIKIEPWFFFAAALLAIAIAVFTTGYQAVKAALTDPVRTLKYE